MKKFLAVAASAVLTFSVFGFTACGKDGGESGEIKGNYTKPTEEQLTSALDSIDFNKAFGDENTASGLEILSKLSTSISSSSGNSQENFTIGYKLSFSEDELLGSGTISAKSENKSGNTTQSTEFTATVYNDSNWGYAEVTGLTEAPFKGKIDFGSLIPEYPGGDDSWVTPTVDEEIPETKFDAATIIETCNQFKIDLGLDTSDGVKLKASVTENTIWAMLTMADITEEQIAVVKEIITFNSFKFDLYLAFDSQKVFSQASVDMDIDLKIDGDKLAAILENLPIDGIDSLGGISGEVAFKLNGYLTVKSFNGTVTLPTGIENDPTYVDITDMIESLL